jgi:hypothetical protein
VPAVKSALQRARATLHEHRTGRETAPAPPATDQRRLLQAFITAHEQADPEALIALLRDDIRLAISPQIGEWNGRDQVAAALRRGMTSLGTWRALPTAANGQPAAVGYLRRPNQTTFLPFVIGRARHRARRARRHRRLRSSRHDHGLRPTRVPLTTPNETAEATDRHGQPPIHDPRSCHKRNVYRRSVLAVARPNGGGGAAVAVDPPGLNRHFETYDRQNRSCSTRCARRVPLSLLGEDGVLRDSAALQLDVTAELCRTLYRDMVLARRLDEEAYNLQRQGELGLWLSCQGQEGAQVGSIRALRDGDHVFPSYREHAVGLCRGLGPRQLLSQWRGTSHGSWDPAEYRVHIPNCSQGKVTPRGATTSSSGVSRRRGYDMVASHSWRSAASWARCSGSMVPVFFSRPYRSLRQPHEHTACVIPSPSSMIVMRCSIADRLLRRRRQIHLNPWCIVQSPGAPEFREA